MLLLYIYWYQYQYRYTRTRVHAHCSLLFIAITRIRVVRTRARVLEYGAGIPDRYSMPWLAIPDPCYCILHGATGIAIPIPWDEDPTQTRTDARFGFSAFKVLAWSRYMMLMRVVDCTKKDTIGIEIRVLF